MKKNSTISLSPASSSPMGSFLILRRRTFVIIAFLLLTILSVIYYVNRSTNSWNGLQVLEMVKKSKFFINNFRQSNTTRKRHKNHGLILDTPGCRIPKLDPFDPTVIEQFEAKEGPYPCPGPPLLLNSQPDGSISLNESVLQEHYKMTADKVVCAYQAIKRKYEVPGNTRENDCELQPYQFLQFGTPLKEDYVVVDCILDQNQNYTHFFPLVYLKDDVEEVKSALEPPPHRLNVIVAGVDSISKLNFLRHFKKTHAFIKEKGTFFDIKGYTKVGDNTFPNLTPLLTGRDVAEVWNETVADTMAFDEVDFIWKGFSAAGYRTFYAEDSPYYGTFNYGRRGFNVTPTDYYIRPLYLVMHNSNLRNTGPWYCFNSMVETDVIYTYLRDFVRAMDNTRPYFAFNMVSALTHDYLNHAGYADYTTVGLLEDLWATGADNNTVVVLFGDHGIRYGAIRKTYIGKHEERMPFMYIHYPKWFVDQNPEYGHHLQTNQNRLVTLFDIHATMTHLLHPESTAEQRLKLSPHGLSLMDEISPYRTCVQANIMPHWCVCQVVENVSPLSLEIVKSASVSLQCINNALRTSNACPELEVSSILHAKLGQMSDLVLRMVGHQNIVIDRGILYDERAVKYEDFVVTFVAKPSEQVFESTVRHDVVEDTYCVVDVLEVSDSEYQSSCIDTNNLKTSVNCYQ